MDAFISELIAAAKTAGPFSTLLMLALWYMERGERKDKETKWNELFERALTTMQEGADALKELRRVIRGEHPRD